MGQSNSKKANEQVNENVESIPKNEIEDYYTALDEEGLSNFEEKINNDLNKWRKIQVNVAVTGDSGTGKSSFINALRGLDVDAEGAAEVGITETTRSPTKYIHPDNPNIVLWDLPGVGTPECPEGTYLEKVGFQSYDFFVIITATRFTENDLWLAQSVRKLGKKFYCVRSKIAFDLNMHEKNHPNTEINREKLIDKVRNNCLENLKNGGIDKTKVYIIDNYVPLDYDFPCLVDQLITDLPKLKQDAMIFTLNLMTESFILKKKQEMQRRIWLVAIKSGVGALTPAPAASLVIDVGIVLSEAIYYKKLFGIDNNALDAHAKKLDISLQELIDLININPNILSCTKASILTLCTLLAESEAVEQAVKTALPLIGCAVAGAISYGSTVRVLRYILNLIVECSLKISRETASKTAQACFELP